MVDKSINLCMVFRHRDSLVEPTSCQNRCWEEQDGASRPLQHALVAGDGEPDLRPSEKFYQQRKLVRIMPVMCLGTQANLKSPYRE